MKAFIIGAAKFLLARLLTSENVARVTALVSIMANTDMTSKEKREKVVEGLKNAAPEVAESIARLSVELAVYLLKAGSA